MSALQITDPNQFSGSFLQAFVGSSQMIVMSLASVLLSIMIALIPFIASRIVRGEVGGTLMTVIGGVMTAGALASSLAFAGGGGLAAGRLTAPEGPPPAPGGAGGGGQGPGAGGQSPVGGGQGQGPSVTGGVVLGELRPPTPPASDGTSAGSGTTGPALNSTTPPAADAASSYRGRSLAGFAAWRTGHLVGRTMRLVGMGKEQ